MNNGIEHQNYNYTFGILTAMAIIFVVAGHLNYDIFTIEGFFPYYSFYMPLFVFISGCFYKEMYEKNIRKFLVKKGKEISLAMMYYGWIPTCSVVFGEFFGNPFIQYIVAFMGIAFWLRIAKIITPIVKKDGWLIYLGKNSFSVMMHHIWIIYILMLLLVCISKVSGFFQDIDINTVKTSAGNWYCPNENQNFLLFYLIISLAVCTGLRKIKDNIKWNLFTKNKSSIKKVVCRYGR